MYESEQPSSTMGPDRDPFERRRESRDRNYHGNKGYNHVPRERNTAGGHWRRLRSFSSSLELSLRPRSFAELTDKRMLLLHELQTHDRDVRDMFARLLEVDEQAMGDETSRERKLSQAHRRSLQRQIGNAIDRERELLLRLSEVSVEVQCRERWCQVRRDHEAELMWEAKASGVYPYQGFFPSPTLPPYAFVPPCWPAAPAFGLRCSCDQCSKTPQAQQYVWLPPQVDAPGSSHQPPTQSYPFKSLLRGCSDDVETRTLLADGHIEGDYPSHNTSRRHSISAENTMAHGLQTRQSSFP